MKLFENYDNVYLINLKKRKDRLDNFKNQVSKYNLGKFEMFEAVDGNKLNIKTKLLPGERGIIKSVINILEDAISKNYSKILIVEDDCEFNENMNSINEYYSHLPLDWDMVYFGGNHNTHAASPPPEKINNYIVRLKHTYSAHCIAIKNNMFNVILESIKHFNFPLDVSYQHLQNYFNVYGFYPGVAYQKPDFSDIQKQFVDYTWLIK